MNVIETHDFLMWGAVVALVLLATFTGMWLNKFFTYRAHRRALAELRRRAMLAEKTCRPESVAVSAEVK